MSRNLPDLNDFEIGQIVDKVWNVKDFVNFTSVCKRLRSFYYEELQWQKLRKNDFRVDCWPDWSERLFYTEVIQRWKRFFGFWQLHEDHGVVGSLLFGTIAFPCRFGIFEVVPSAADGDGNDPGEELSWSDHSIRPLFSVIYPKPNESEVYRSFATFCVEKRDESEDIWPFRTVELRGESTALENDTVAVKPQQVLSDSTDDETDKIFDALWSKRLNWLTQSYNLSVIQHDSSGMKMLGQLFGREEANLRTAGISFLPEKRGVLEEFARTCYDRAQLLARSNSRPSPIPWKLTRVPRLSASARAPQQVFPRPGIYAGDYGGHGIELVNVYYSREAEKDSLVAAKVTGDANIPAHKVSFRVNLDQVVNLSLLELLDENAMPNDILLDALPQHLTPFSDFRRSQMPIPVDLLIDLFEEAREVEKLRGRSFEELIFAGQGQIAMEGYRNNEWIVCMLLVVSDWEFAALWPGLESISTFKRLNGLDNYY